MKNLLSILAVAFLVVTSAYAQDAQTVKLEQVPGEFTETSLKLKAGESYIFEVVNNGIDHAVGFVVAPKGKTEQENHISSAYLTNTIEDGQTGKSNVVTLEKGEYVYFCPLNPTPQYSITVE
ncbi:MAG: cupredoxin domain-containing protein [Bacteroidota bacterium]